MLTWQQFLLEKTEHKFCSTHVKLPADLTAKINNWSAKTIADEDLAPDGRETDLHVTVLYGLHDNDPDQVREVLAGETPVELTLAKTSLFANPEHDVVKLSVVSPDLIRLNKKLKSHCSYTDKYDYKPHCTLAYVESGKGHEYEGLSDWAGTKVIIPEIVFSDRDRKKTTVPLTINEAKRSEFAVLKDNKERLDGAEREQAMAAGCCWHFGHHQGKPSCAIYRSKDSRGKTWFCSNTHRAYDKSPTLAQAIKRFHSFVKPSS
jgi:2'-5' RNA ligase